MSSSGSWRFSGPERPAQDAGGPPLRVANSPLPRELEGRVQQPAAQDSRRFVEDPRPARPAESPLAGFAGVMQRLATLGRTVLPLLPHLLPMDRRVGVAVSAVSNMVAARTQTAGAPPRAVEPKPDPLAESLAELRSGHGELRDQLAAQAASVKQLEEQLSAVRKAAEQQAQEQEELVASSKTFRKKALLFGIAASVLLVASIICDVILLVRR